MVAKNDQEEAYEKVLVASLTRVTDWLKFAETKNGALLAFVSGWTVAIANLIAKDGGPPAAFAGVLPISAYLFISAGLILLIAFVPKITLSDFFRTSAATHRPVNYIFYGDIAEQSIVGFSGKLKARYLPADGASAAENYLDDLAVQIHVISVIARFKFRMFKAAGWLTVAGLVILAWPIAESVLEKFF